MASLAETNPYLKDRKKMLEMIARNTYDSAVFEGASPRSLKAIGYEPSPRGRTARSKKRAKSP